MHPVMIGGLVITAIGFFLGKKSDKKVLTPPENSDSVIPEPANSMPTAELVAEPPLLTTEETPP
jgi:hypothetical protein